MAGEVDERAVVDDAAAGLADDRRLHAVVEDLAGTPPIASKAAMWQRRTVCRSWCRTKRAQINRLIAEHEREQPDDPRHRRLVGEDDLELGKVDLRLLARRRLEANLEAGVGAGRRSRRKSVTAV